MLLGKKIEKILKNKTGQDAIIEIDNLLTKIFYENPSKLSLPEKNIVYIEELEHEINNGGFNQYFSNSSGDNSNETLEALKIIKSKVFYDILKNAIDKFPNGVVPKDRGERENIVTKIDKEVELWNYLDNEFYKYEEDIYKLMVEYIKNNIKDFR